jgi:L-cysteine:1D-myo-inositol 2-amino-2-deoxy-alpha-D-glucopyranoside ligase
VGDLLKEWEAPAVRLALLDHHYRHDWEWGGDDMPRAKARLERWRSAGRDGHGERALDAVRHALDDDLDTPAALAALDAAAVTGESVVAGAALLGVSL